MAFPHKHKSKNLNMKYYLKSIIVGILSLLILFGILLLKFSFNEIKEVFALKELRIISTIVILASSLLFAFMRFDPKKNWLIISLTQSFIITTLCHLHTYFIN